MKKIVMFLFFALMAATSYAQHNAGHQGKVLLIVSNPAVSKQTGWDIGVWASEITHPYWEFTEAGYTVEFASPNGGEVRFDAFSDPEDASQYAAFDIISLGFKKDPAKMALLKNTQKLSEVDPDQYKAIFVCGGQGPMYTFYENEELHRFFAAFYSTGKPAAAICHGTNILLKTRLANGRYLVEGKSWTGFANSEEQYADNYVGMQIQPFRIEEEARKLPKTNFQVGAPFSSFALRDGNLITGQQQNSGAAAARLVIEAIEADKARYPTYVLVHGAWADESAWGFVRNALAVRGNVVVVNLPGHGIDLTPLSQVDLYRYVDAVAEVIRDQPGQVILVGHSMAGMVISQVAELMPEKIDRLVYVAAYLPQDGETLLSLSEKDKESKVGAALEFAPDYSSATIRKEMIVPAVCADCPDFMQEALVKYHKAQAAKPLSGVVSLSAGGFGSVPKFYVHTTRDQAVGYHLQKMMVEKNGKIEKTFRMDTSHLPFVVQPAAFVDILDQITSANVE